MRGELATRKVGDVPFVAFDLETTGLSAVADRIVEIGAVKFVGGRPLQTFDALVDPGVAIPPEVTAIHGITDGMVQGEPGIAEVLPEFLRFLEGSVPVAYNAPFDVAFLAFEIARRGFTGPPTPFLDACRLARLLLPGLPAYNLPALATRLHIEVPRFHRALTDAHACMGVFVRCLERLKGGAASLFWTLLNLQGGPLHLEMFTKADLPMTEDLAVLQQAIEVGGTIRIQYRDSRGGMSFREITPYSLVPFRGEVYVEAFCHLRQGTRQFRLDRILRIVPNFSRRTGALLSMSSWKTSSIPQRNSSGE